MVTNFYEQYYQAQKDMFNVWNKYMNPMNGNETKKNENKSFNPMDYYNEMIEINKNMSNNFLKFFESPQNIWEKMNEAYKSYYEIYKLWQKLTFETNTLDSKSASKIYNEWQDQYYDYMKKYLISNLPDYIKELMNKFIKTAETYSSTMNTFWNPWIENEGELKDKLFNSLMNDPGAYLDFLEVWRKNYDESFSKLMNAPMVGKDRELLEKQRYSMDKFIKFSIILSEFYTKIFQITQDTNKKVMDDYIKMYSEGTQPKTFEEFYKYWTSQINNAYDKVFFSDDFSKLVGHTIEAMANFKKEYDKLFEEYLTYLPVPKQSEMDSLYKTVYDLKKELRSLKSNFNTLKKSISSENKSEDTATTNTNSTTKSK